jgi:hypothetical protein
LACGEPARKALTQHAAGWPEIGCFIETNERRRC